MMSKTARKAMARPMLTAGVVMIALAAVAAPALAQAPDETVQVVPDRPAIPPTPAAVERVLYARTFALAEPVRYTWAADVGEITGGTILVLATDPAFLRHRALAEPVLYVGDRPAWRVSHETAAGRVVAIVPGEVDLAATPIFWGAPALPQEIDTAAARDALARATAAGVRAPRARDAQRARDAGGPTLELSGRLDLLTATQELIDRYVAR
jgi:hypothetical protein